MGRMQRLADISNNWFFYRRMSDLLIIERQTNQLDTQLFQQKIDSLIVAR